MEDNATYWLWLSEMRGVWPVTCKKLLQAFHSPEAVYHASKEELLSVPGAGNSMAELILSSRSLRAAEGIRMNV